MSANYSKRPVRVAIVDYGMGNLFSVKRACERVGVEGLITSSKVEIFDADGVILPGVGAFGDAMNALRSYDLIPVIKDFVRSDRPFFGICLGFQLLMDKSFEFGEYPGLGIIPGEVVCLDKPTDKDGSLLKIPHVGWNCIHPSNEKLRWEDALLKGIPAKSEMYFVHSYCVLPENQNYAAAFCNYGNLRFCAAIQKNNLFACQFHPERSGELGLSLYRNFAETISRNNGKA